jgi:hypothetical protein
VTDRGGLSARTNINTAPRYREQSLGSTRWTKLGASSPVSEELKDFFALINKCGPKDWRMAPLLTKRASEELKDLVKN